MFPSDNFEPTSKRWVETVQNVIQSTETQRPRQESELERLQREARSVMDDVSSQVNSYYTNTLAQYPAYQRTVPMRTALGGLSKTISVSAAALPGMTLPETWISVFSTPITLNIADTVAGVRLNSAQFGLQGPTGYYLKFRWLVNGSVEGINNNQWMSRHSFNLSVYQMDPTTPVLTNVTNRYAHWSGASTSTLNLELQVSIENIASRGSAVAATNVTLLAQDNNGNDTYLDVMVTV